MSDSYVCAGCGVPLPFELGPEVLPSCPNCQHEHSPEERAGSRPGGDPGCQFPLEASTLGPAGELLGRAGLRSLYDPTLGEALERGRDRRRFRAPAADDACGVELDPEIASGLDALEDAMEARRWFDWAVALVDELGLTPGPCSNPADVEGWSDDKLRERIAGLLYQLEAEDL